MAAAAAAEREKVWGVKSGGGARCGMGRDGGGRVF